MMELLGVCVCVRARARASLLTVTHMSHTCTYHRDLPIAGATLTSWIHNEDEMIFVRSVY